MRYDDAIIICIEHHKKGPAIILQSQYVSRENSPVTGHPSLTKGNAYSVREVTSRRWKPN